LGHPLGVLALLFLRWNRARFELGLYAALAFAVALWLATPLLAPAPIPLSKELSTRLVRALSFLLPAIGFFFLLRILGLGAKGIRVAIILPAGAVGRTLGGTPITAQNANGAVFVAATTVPVLVRDNFDNARIWGIEHTLTASLRHGLLARSTYTYIRAEDTATNLSPNIEGGTPQPSLTAMVRWSSPAGRVYVEPYVQAAWTQTHLSSLDLGDRRTGASRSTTSIRNFFNNF